MSNARIGNLDVLRFIAALAVVLYHYMFRGVTADGLSLIGADIAQYGYLGVSCFFVISGFVIAYSAEGRGVVAFAAARISRLYPAFLICMTITALVSLLLAAPGNPLRPTITSYLANLTMFAPAFRQPFMDGAYWSIVVEIVFYGWMALLIMSGLFATRMVAILAVWLLIGLGNELTLQAGVLRIVLLTQYAGHFSMGILLYRLCRNGWRFRLGDSLVGVLAAILIAIGELNSIVWMENNFGVESNRIVAFGGLALSILAVPVCVRLPALAPPPFTLALGGISYPLYLLHQHIGYLIFQNWADLVNGWVLLIGCILVLSLVSWAVWRFIECPVTPRLRRSLNGAGDKLLLMVRVAIARRSTSHS